MYILLLKLSTLTFTLLSSTIYFGDAYFLNINDKETVDKSLKDLKTTDKYKELTESFSLSIKPNTVCIVI
jgi:hypothetical protein